MSVISPEVKSCYVLGISGLSSSACPPMYDLVQQWMGSSAFLPGAIDLWQELQAVFDQSLEKLQALYIASLFRPLGNVDVL